MSWEQCEAFLGAARSERRYRALFATLVYGGLRPGEAFALKPGDLDFGQRLIRVERAWSLGQMKDTKTRDERAVDMSADLVAVRREYLVALKAEALKRGWGEPEWLFPNDANHPMDEAKVSRVFRLVVKRAGLPAFRVYDLRHTPSRASCWPPARQSPTWPRSSATRTRRRRSGSTPGGSPRAASGGWRCWIAAIRGRPWSVFWPIWNQKWNQTGLRRVEVLWKCAILNGAGGGS